MQYQRKHKTIEKEEKEPLEENNNNNIKKIVNKTSIEAERKQSRITTKPINISTIATGKKEIKKTEKNIKRISYVKTEKQYKKIESPSIMEARPPTNRIKYHNNRNQDEISPIFKEQISAIEDPEYNIHTLNARKSPDNISYGRNSIENEKQTKKKNYNQYSSNPLFDNIQNLDQDTFKTNTNESIKINYSAFNTNIKSYRPPMIPQNKMSPIQRYDEGNSSYENKRYAEQRNRYGNYLNANANTNPTAENINLNISNINNNNMPQGGRNTVRLSRGRFLTDANSPSYQNERVNSQNSSRNQVSYKELKRIVKKFNKVYDPYKNEKGLLIKQSQITLPGASDEIFNNRYRVLSKMNKLSNILLAKQLKTEEDDYSSRGNSREAANLFERDRSLSKTSNSKSKDFKKNKRLLLFSLAMMSSKGPNTEDRAILRKNRIEKGGVVDLAQEKINKNKFKIKKATKVGGHGKVFINSNPKYREKAAKIIQAWWKELKDIYNYKLSQIIKIQSIWKGRWVRKNIYDLLYLNYLYLSFCEKIEKVLTDEMRRFALNKLKENQKNSQAADKNKLKVIVLKANQRRMTSLRNCWENWIKQIQNERQKKNKGKSLIHIRADKENKLGKLRTAFTVWKYNIKMEKIKNEYTNDNKGEENNINGQKIIKITKISEKEKYYREGGKDNIIEKDKFKGLLFILDGVKNYHKKQAFQETKPKLTKYLTELAKQEKLKDLLNNKNNRINYILKKNIYKWITQTIKASYNEKETDDNDNLRAKMFLRRIENMKNKHNKVLLRKYFYRYLKIVLILGKKEERQKLLDVYKNDTNNYNTDAYNSNTYDKDIVFSLSAYARARNRKKKMGLKNVVGVLEGSKVLEKFIWRQTYGDILDYFTNKLDNEMTIKYLIKIIKIKEKILQNILKAHLDRWKNNTLLKKNDDLKYRLFIKILKIIIENNQKKLLSKKLYQWQKIVHILNGKDNIFLKNKNLSNFFHYIKKFVVKNQAPDFIDKLKHIRKDIDYNELLRKNIIKQDIKKNKLFLKDILNRWKNKVTNYEIGKLKGNIILKIYDKYKLGKEKDILKKYIKKWENNTIFFDKIKNRLKNEDIDEFNKMNNKEKISILLRVIIRNINRKNSEIIIRKYFNIWKKNIKDWNKTLGAAGMYILKIIKTNDMKFFFDKLKGNRKEKILKNIVYKYSRLKRKIVIKEYYFRRWIYIVKILEQIENANIIQKYCLMNLKKNKIGKRWKKLYILLKNRIKINEIKNILNRLKKYLGIIKLIKALKGNNKNNIFDKKFIAHFFDKLYDLLNNLNNQNYSYYLLKKVINKQNNKKISILLKNAINKWKNKIAEYEIGKLKGKLLLKIYDKYNDAKIKDILKKVLIKWKNNTIFLDKIKNQINKENKDIFTKISQKDKIIIIIKSIIRNINRKNNAKILSKYFNIWKKKIQDRNQILGQVVTIVIKIIKINNGQHFFKKLKENKKENILRNIVDKYEKSKDNIIDSYFAKWKYITKKLEQIENANIIQMFCLINLRNRANKNKWKKLYLLLKNKIRNNDIKDLLKKLKKYIGIIKLINAIKGNNENNIFDKRHMKFFFDKLKDILNNLNNQNNSYQYLKRVINKQNNKINKILLKNAINKWRNIVADYEIGRLKGKLLLKIYDKYKNAKIKYILRKILKGWENRAVILVDIKNRINKENLDKLNDKSKRDKLIIILKSILRNINRKNNDKELRKYFNIWRKNIQNRNKSLGAAGMYIIKILRINNEKYFFDKLKDNRKEKILNNLFDKYAKLRKNNDILQAYLNKWRYINKYLEQINNAKIIQKFCLIKLRKREIIKKWNKLYSLLKEREIKLNRNDILSQLKKYIGIIKLIKYLNDKNSIFDKAHIKYFLDKLKDILKNSKDQDYLYLILKKIIIKQNNNKNNKILKKVIYKWKNEVADYEIGKLKGKLLLKIYDKYKNGKIKEILKKIISKWENNTIFLDKIKNRINKENKDIFTKINKKDKTIIIIKSIIRNINRKINDKILRKYFNKWKKNIQGRNKNLDDGGKKILKIIIKNKTRDFINKLKENKKYDILKNIFIKNEKPNEDILDAYLSRWKYINKKLEQIENANIIQMFCLINLRNRTNKNKWKKLYLLLKNKIRNNDIKDLLKKLKKYIGIIKLINAIKGNNENNIFDKRHMKFFFDKLKDILNNLNNQNNSYQYLKRVINKQNNKINKILLKNAINKWRNIVADYEIGRLKGKLLLKIYDKYKNAKIKYILRKILKGWENRAVILVDIKNRINKENLDKLNDKSKRDKLIIILKSILRNINRKNNDKELRKYFNIWRKNIQNRNKSLGAAGMYIIKILRINNEKYFFDKLKDNRKEKILNNLFDKYAKLRKNNDILQAYLNKWRYINKYLEQINNAKIIQKFCLIKLRKREIIKKWNKLYSLLKEREIKLNRNDILSQLKKYIGIIKLIKYLNDKNSIFDKAHIKYFLDKLKDILKNSKDQDYLYLILKKIIIKQNNNKNNKILKKVIYKWKNEVADYEIGKLKGKLLLKIYDKYKNGKIKEILKKIISKWENNTIFLDKIKNRINKENKDIFTKINKKDKTIIIIKSIIRNINRKINDKILRKYFNKWKKNIQGRNKNLDDGGKKILKIIIKNKTRDFINKLKENKKYDILKNIFIKNEKPNEDILDAYLSRWRYINKKLEQIKNANIIQRFCEMKLRNMKNTNRWKKLYLLLRNIHRKNNIKDIINKMKYYIGIKKLINSLTKNNKRNIFNLLNKQKDNKKILYISIEIYERFKTENDKNLLKKYFSKWRNNIRKKEALEKMLNILEISSLKTYANKLADASNLIKLLRDIIKARALYFLRKIKIQGKKNNLYNNLSKNLVNANNELLNNNKKPIIDKILRIYAYKIISNLFDGLGRINKNNLKQNIREFFAKLYLINIQKKRKKYRKTNKLERKPHLYKGIRFHRFSNHKLRRDEKDNKMIIYRELVPFLTKYLNKVFNTRKIDIFNKIKYNNIGLGDKFCKLLKIFSKKTQIPDKEDLVDSLKYYVYMKLTKESNSNKLYYLIRKAIIRKILNISKTIGNVNRLLRLVDITMTHKNIAEDRWILRLIKKWRFLTFVKKMAMKKMELMYKDLHVTYLEMADSVLKDGSPLGPNGSNFLHDINKDKYFYDFYDPYLVKGAKPYKAIKKEIVFEPLDAEIERRVKTIQEIETINKTKEINNTYYVPDDIGKTTKKFSVLKTKKVNLKPKKTGKTKIKKSYESSTFDRNKIYGKNIDLRESNKSSIRESSKNEIKSEVGDSIENEYKSGKFETINNNKINNEKSRYYIINSYKKGPDYYKKYEKRIEENI